MLLASDEEVVWQDFGYEDFDERAIVALDVAKMPCGFAHVKTIGAVRHEWINVAVFASIENFSVSTT